MLERQLFCWSEKYGDSLSKQQKDYRIFNQQVDKNIYKNRLSEICALIPNPKNLPLVDFWKSLTGEQISALSKIPEFDATGFEFITGRKVEKSEVEKAIELLIAAGKLVDGKILA